MTCLRAAAIALTCLLCSCTTPERAVDSCEADAEADRASDCGVGGAGE